MNNIIWILCDQFTYYYIHMFFKPLVNIYNLLLFLLLYSLYHKTYNLSAIINFTVKYVFFFFYFNYSEKTK
jgi:hypothetical protein